MRDLRYTPDDLGLADITTTSFHVDGFHEFDTCGGEREEGSKAIEIIVPDPTEDEIENHFAEQWAEALADNDGDTDAAMRDLRDNLTMSDTYHEWLDGYFPMMNFIWPVRLRYGEDPQDLATLMTEHAPNVTLIRYDEESDGTPIHGFCLTGGGMDLSDCLARAYIVAGQVPPLGLLESRWADSQIMENPTYAAHWTAARKRAASWLRTKAEYLDPQPDAE